MRALFAPGDGVEPAAQTARQANANGLVESVSRMPTWCTASRVASTAMRARQPDHLGGRRARQGQHLEDVPGRCSWIRIAGEEGQPAGDMAEREDRRERVLHEVCHAGNLVLQPRHVTIPRRSK